MDCATNEWLTISQAASLLATTETRILMLMRQPGVVKREGTMGWEIERTSLLQGRTGPQTPGHGGCGGCSGHCSSKAEG